MANGRDERGRFALGNRFQKNGGRKPREVEHRLFQLMASQVSNVDWQKIVTAQVEAALSGNLAAATWLSDRLMGRPIERSESDTVNWTPEEWERKYGGEASGTE